MYKTDNCTITAIITLLCFNIIIFFVLIFIISETSSNPIYAHKNEIITAKSINYESNFVNNLYATIDPECRPGFQPLFKNLNSGKTKSYCSNKDPNNPKTKNINNQGQESKELTEADDSRCPKGYKNIPRTNGLILQRLNAKLVCAEFTKFNFDDYIYISKEDTCPIGKRNCGNVSSKKFCLSELFDCPLNDIKIFNSDQSNSELSYYEKINIGSDMYIYFTNERVLSGNMVTDDWIIADPSGVCLNPKEIKTAYKNLEWQYWDINFVEKCKSTIENNNLDNNYKLMIELNWIDLLKYNHIDGFLPNHHIDLNIDQIPSKKIGIFTKNKIFFDNSCYKHKLFITSFKQFGVDHNYAHFFILIVISIILNLCGIILLMFQLLMAFLLKKGVIVSNYTKNWKMLVNSLACVGIFDFLMISILIIVLCLIEINNGFIDKIFNVKTCVDDSTYNFIKFFYDKNNSFFLIYLLVCISSGIIICFVLVLFQIIIIKNFKKFENENKEQSNKTDESDKSHLSKEKSQSSIDSYNTNDIEIQNFQTNSESNLEKFKSDFFSRDYDSNIEDLQIVSLNKSKSENPEYEIPNKKNYFDVANINMKSISEDDADDSAEIKNPYTGMSDDTETVYCNNRNNDDKSMSVEKLTENNSIGDHQPSYSNLSTILKSEFKDSFKSKSDKEF